MKVGGILTTQFVHTPWSAGFDANLSPVFGVIEKFIQIKQFC